MPPIRSEGYKPHHSDAIEVLNAKSDFRWALQNNDSDALHNYFDYYFSGQDVLVYVDGVEDELPIEGLAFQVEQKKAPLYGYASYTYDAVMRGQRMIVGSFTITTTTPGYMTTVLSQAATARASRKSGGLSRYDYVPSISENSSQSVDQDNVDRYWTISREKTRSGFFDNKHIFSSHPPFSMVLVYGLQTSSIVDNQLVHQKGRYEKYLTDTALYTDVNERLTETSSRGSNRIVIDSIELNTCQYEYSPTGQPLAETYTFFAKDIYVTQV